MVRTLDPSFTGHVYDYETLATSGEREPYPPFPLVKGVIPSWDNDARRAGAGVVVRGSTPARYQRWLRSAIEVAERHPVLGERLVFVNAWNEWAEGAYLEPDVHFGAAYLNATARAVCGPG
jgi:lipopolysaccharide biosynthesis protein